MLWWSKLDTDGKPLMCLVEMAWVGMGLLGASHHFGCSCSDISLCGFNFARLKPLMLFATVYFSRGALGFRYIVNVRWTVFPLQLTGDNRFYQSIVPTVSMR
jgi:hypothetical protein